MVIQPEPAFLYGKVKGPLYRAPAVRTISSAGCASSSMALKSRLSGTVSLRTSEDFTVVSTYSCGNAGRTPEAVAAHPSPVGIASTTIATIKRHIQEDR